MLLACKAVEEAKFLLDSVPHASGMNYTVASPTDWASLECSANKVCECIPEGESHNYSFLPHTGHKVFTHTNHPLKSDDLVKPDPYVSLSSRNRLSYLQEKLASIPHSEIDEEHIKAWLGNHPVCLYEEHNTGFTFGSIVAVLNKESPILYLSPGPPSVTPWITLTFNK